MNMDRNIDMGLVRTPIKIGEKEVPTRIVFPPMATQGSLQGKPSEELAEHYERIARNKNVGLITTEYGYVTRPGMSDFHQVSFSSDDVIPYQRQMVERIHATRPDILLIAQINHAGGNTSPAVTGEMLVAPSRLEFYGGQARELTIPEIKRIEQEFANAAVRVKESGYDGVELHSAHGFLMNEFYSPLTNHRTDEYGAASVENRLRFLTETIDLVRKAVGQDFIISVRLGGSDYMAGGSTASDAVKAAKILEGHGIDLLSISGGLCGMVNPHDRSPGYFRDVTRPIKEAVSIPVLLTGGVKTLQEAEELLQEGDADLIGVGRALFKNSQWGMR